MSNHKCDVLCMQETHIDPGAVRPRLHGMNLVAAISHEQYDSALFIRVSLPPPPALPILRKFKQH